MNYRQEKTGRHDDMAYGPYLSIGVSLVKLRGQDGGNESGSAKHRPTPTEYQRRLNDIAGHDGQIGGRNNVADTQHPVSDHDAPIERTSL